MSGVIVALSDILAGGTRPSDTYFNFAIGISLILYTLFAYDGYKTAEEVNKGK